MIKGLPAYADYRPSGIPWLGYDIPTHWTRRKLRSLFARQGSGTTPSGNHHYNGPVCWVMSGDLNDGILSATKRTVKTSTPLNVPSLRVYPTKSLVVAMYGATIGRASILSVPACTNQACAAFADPNDDCNVKYVHHVVVTARSYLVQQAYGGGQPNINAHVLCSLPVPLPPPDEQAAIVRFLDWATRRVDRAIRAKRRLVALLTEQKQAIIHRAVTQGLDPSVPMKASGIPWLGEIPAHWELRPARTLVRIRTELVGRRHLAYRLLSLTKQGVIVRDLTGMRGKFSADMSTFQTVRPADFVLCLFDVPETPRTVGRSRHEGMITGAYTVCEPIGSCNGAYFEAYLIALDDRKLLAPLYSGLRNTIPKERFLGMKVPFPPLDEQVAIVTHVGEATAGLDKTIERTQRQIGLLREYRARLVSDVVTGKLDVRAFAETLPDEAPDDIEAVEADVDEDADDDETGDGADEG